jgi:hypothetical protein
MIAFPGGKHKVVTMSYDDGKAADRQLVNNICICFMCGGTVMSLIMIKTGISSKNFVSLLEAVMIFGMQQTLKLSIICSISKSQILGR